MIELIESRKLTPAAAKQILLMQFEMNAAIQAAATDLEGGEPPHRRPHV
jgi:hypothetical protein